ncbi:MAG: phosphate ABC transporter substrate-binding protein PstS [Dermatophilaceae bacterium]
MRLGRLSGVAIIGAFALTACGTDTNTNTNAGAPSSSGSSTTSSAGASSAGGMNCATGSLQLAGSTAQSNAMAEWIKQYQQACPGANINYGGGGSGAGVQQFSDGTIDFAGSDFPLDAKNRPAANARCKTGSAINLPMVPGPIAMGYNLPGVSFLNLSASNLAKIFAGKITKWNDPAIAKDNPGVKLPTLGIQTFHRADGSGTSYNFTNYLANEAKANWSFGPNKDWKAPGGQGAKGSQGVAQGVKSTPGGIGYFEQSFADQSKIPYAKVSNAAGDFVELTKDNTVSFLSKAKVAGTGGDLTLEFDYTNTDKSAYPNLLVTYEIVCAQGNDPAKLPLVKSFLGYAASDAGQNLLPDLGYVKLPTNIQQKVQKSVRDLA